jgi:hypothetical protein
MTTEDALLVLSEDQENAKALLELGMNERPAIEKAARRWFVGRNEAYLAFYSILPLLALNAKSYDPRIHDAHAWVEEHAALQARHLYIHKTPASAIMN